MTAAIIAFLIKRGVPEWVIKPLAIVVAVVAIGASSIWYRDYLINVGVQKESARRDEIDQIRDAKAKLDLALMNDKVAKAQEIINGADSSVTKLQEKLKDAQGSNAALQSDLASSRQRLRVAVSTASSSTQAESSDGPIAGRLDNQPSFTAYLDPEASRRVAQLTGEGDEAIIRLNACVERYQSLSSAVNLIASGAKTDDSLAEKGDNSVSQENQDKEP